MNDLIVNVGTGIAVTSYYVSNIRAFAQKLYDTLLETKVLAQDSERYMQKYNDSMEELQNGKLENGKLGSLSPKESYTPQINQENMHDASSTTTANLSCTNEVTQKAIEATIEVSFKGKHG
ncbi:MAG: hypothetical protein ACI9CD_001187 [Candidatus Deianiraeaceae bacterium]